MPGAWPARTAWRRCGCWTTWKTRNMSASERPARTSQETTMATCKQNAKGRKRWVVLCVPGPEAAWYVYDRRTRDAARCADAGDAARFCRACNGLAPLDAADE